MNCPRIQYAGFTLVELMVTVALAAILAFVAVPNLSLFKRNAELTSATNALVAAISTARSEALKRNYNAVVLPADGTRWESGWIVFVDTNLNNRFDAASETLLTTQGALPEYFSVSKLPVLTTPIILFDASGFSKNTSGGFGAANFTIARRDLTGDELLNQTRRIIVASTGRIRSCNPKRDRDCDSTSN